MPENPYLKIVDDMSGKGEQSAPEAEAKVNPYLSVVDDMAEADSQEAVSPEVHRAVANTSDPAKEGEVARLSGESGWPKDTIRKNMDAAQNSSQRAAINA